MLHCPRMGVQNSEVYLYQQTRLPPPRKQVEFIEMLAHKAALLTPYSNNRQLKQPGMPGAAPCTSMPGSHIWIRRARKHAYTRLPDLEPTPSGQATYHMCQLLLQQARQSYSTVYTETTFSRLVEIAVQSNS